ncbi:hypothetical protein AUK40_05600 [Candidatus Wirthbacteria bacterium CG2_30_54_11]|uniref:FAD-binding FR-type domain-containing protein n=1 Tax=Candidatus Wirthbacteria bacterium CG2_30_54_11 TaxID=1817892 RepID=A0A1J5IGQ1_9BACT|nr:MAG: hypothetical protein AUK40_05600 [Candidatus Wirthbacteria bacterium CG2_30_54_11]
MLVSKYPSEVISAEQKVPGIFMVSLKSLGRPYRFKPGQFLHLALDAYDPSGPWPESRCFSIQTCCSDELLTITYAVKGAFTQRMAAEITPGHQVWLKLPFGDIFDQGHDQANCVFIAGGTGITPFLSLFTDSSFAEYRMPHLYLGVRSPEFHLYAGEIKRAQAINPSFGVDVVVESASGILKISDIFQQSAPDSTFFISGPPVMIKNFRNYLIDQGVAGDKVRTDDWE